MTTIPRALNPMRRINLGPHIFGLAAIISGAITAFFRDITPWGQQVMPLDKVPHPQIFLYITGAIQLLAGIAIQWARTRRLGAILLAGVYLIFTLLWVPEIIAGARIYNNWGAPLYEFSLASGALIVYGVTSSEDDKAAQKLGRIGYIGFGVCVVSFTIEQAVYFSGTTVLVPKWIPGGAVFWGIATTIAFGLAAIALLSGRCALLAARLLTVMLIAFGLLIWIPALVSDPRKLFNWTEHNQNLAIVGAAWIVADFLAQRRPPGAAVVS